MPLLGGLLVSLFSGIVAWLAQYFTRKVAFALAAAAAYATITTALYVAFRAVLAGLDAYASGAPAMFIDAMRMAVPPAAPFCLGTYMTMWTACTVYTWQRDLLFLAAKV